ncbi:hypothetical protein DPMN_023737 [Dreissena polymorpha]|uniref:Uncharacterized protein n=1 Tax=Dreissena polymorpha TaxID=45954 RepID=A0A9D4LLP8_DREPO|nr:hypothetical protein DPMN_023737 [Dreissena polymorpha]
MIPRIGKAYLIYLKEKQTLFILKQPIDIIKTNVLTKFRAEELTRINSPTPDGCFLTEGTFFKLIQDSIKTNFLTNVTFRVKNAPPPGGHTHLLTKIYEDGTINVTSRVLTSHIWQNTSPPGGHVFQQTRIILKLN